MSPPSRSAAGGIQRCGGERAAGGWQAMDEVYYDLVRTGGEMRAGWLILAGLSGCSKPSAIVDFKVLAPEGDLVGPGDSQLAGDGAPDGVMRATVQGPLSALYLVEIGPDGKVVPNIEWDTTSGPVPAEVGAGFETGEQTSILGVFKDGKPVGPPFALDAGSHELTLAVWDNGCFQKGRGCQLQLVGQTPSGAIVRSTPVSMGPAISWFTTAPIASDLVGSGNQGFEPDGQPDGVIEAVLWGPMTDLFLVQLDPSGGVIPQVQWDNVSGPVPPELGTGFTTAEATSILGVYGVDGKVMSSVEPGPHRAELHVWDNGCFQPGSGCRLQMVGVSPDGLVVGPAVPAGPAIPQAKVVPDGADRVGVGDAALSPDGLPDSVVRAEVWGPLSSFYLVQVDADGAVVPGVQWDTAQGPSEVPAGVGAGFATGETTSVLGVFEGGAPVTGPLSHGPHAIEFRVWDNGCFQPESGCALRIVGQTPSGALVQSGVIPSM